MKVETEIGFRQLCHRNGLAATHQRYVIYNVLQEMPGHPGPEEVYSRVRAKIPSISLATVYKTLHAFLESGIVNEVSLHGGSLRVDPNPDFHHHLVCVDCRSITDVPQEAVGPVKMQGKLPQGFQVERYSVEIQGLCSQCAAARRKRGPGARTTTSFGANRAVH
ncbi:MAG TPA: Fur family transcriptional regulator [Candidatus Acidoferrales bacterium]|nr:Fur family transcriptional regulator [Candidatus Acidoferrales bacterium]